MVEKLHPKRWAQNLGQAKSPRPNTIWPWAAVNGAALCPCGAKTFFDEKFEILMKFRSFWVVAVFCSSIGSKVRLSASAHFGSYFTDLRYANGDWRRETPLSMFWLWLFTWYEYQTQIFFTSLYNIYACFGHWGSCFTLFFKNPNQGYSTIAHFFLNQTLRDDIYI